MLYLHMTATQCIQDQYIEKEDILNQSIILISPDFKEKNNATKPTIKTLKKTKLYGWRNPHKKQEQTKEKNKINDALISNFIWYS